jgi:hypothetical protein
MKGPRLACENVQEHGLRPAVRLSAMISGRLRERVRRTDLGFASPFLPFGVIGLLAGALVLA